MNYFVSIDIDVRNGMYLEVEIPKVAKRKESKVSEPGCVLVVYFELKEKLWKLRKLKTI